MRTHPTPPTRATSPRCGSDDGSAIFFTPAPSASTRHDGWTPERQCDFIAQLGRLGVVSAAAGAVGMSAKSAYALRKRAGAESFLAAWDTALEQGRARALDLSIDRTINGTSTPILFRGRHVSVRRVYDNRLLLAALRTIPPPTPTGLSFQQMLDALADAPAPDEPE